eukprot:gene5351-6022_t
MRRAYMPYRSRRHRQNLGKPEPERNIPAAFFSLVIGGIFAVAMAEPNWLKIKGGKCDGQYIGLYKIFGVGHHSDQELEEKFCMNAKVLIEMKVIATCCALAIVCSLAQFSLDTWGVSARCCKTLRKNATGDILAVLFSVTIMILCYLVVVEVENTEFKAGHIVKVNLDIAFYLTVGAGVASVVATTLNLLQCTCEKTREECDDLGMELMYDDMPDDISLPPMPPAYDL